MKRIALMTAMLIVGNLAFAYAGDSVTIAIGCTIPVIPGVNAPAASETLLQEPSAPAVSPQEVQVQAPPQSSQANEPEHTVLLTSVDHTESGIVETVYSR